MFVQMDSSFPIFSCQYTYDPYFQVPFSGRHDNGIKIESFIKSIQTETKSYSIRNKSWYHFQILKEKMILKCMSKGSWRKDEEYRQPPSHNESSSVSFLNLNQSWSKWSCACPIIYHLSPISSINKSSHISTHERKYISSTLPTSPPPPHLSYLLRSHRQKLMERQHSDHLTVRKLHRIIFKNRWRQWDIAWQWILGQY